MPAITVTRNFSVCPLLDIEHPEFARLYGLGMFWALYGEEQGCGPYEDTYLIENMERGINDGWYDNLSSPWFASLGFYLGMLHGGMLDPATRQLRHSETLVVLTDPDFAQGYHVGRDYYFTEALLEGRHLTDTLFMEAINGLALDHHTYRDPVEVIRYALGCRIGELSGAILPLSVDELTSDGTVTTGQVIRLY
jgi:hypothetical protein